MLHLTLTDEQAKALTAIIGSGMSNQAVDDLGLIRLWDSLSNVYGTDIMLKNRSGIVLRLDSNIPVTVHDPTPIHEIDLTV